LHIRGRVSDEAPVKFNVRARRDRIHLQLGRSEADVLIVITALRVSAGAAGCTLCCSGAAAEG
jgi:hypothetical protein